MALLATALVKIRVLRRPMPLFGEWNVTFRCNLRCKYCGACNAAADELGTDDVQRGLDTLWDLGVRWLTFGGGEPLIRKDIGEILAHARARGFVVFLSTNGWLVPQHMDDLRYVDHVNLSLDGPRAVHDDVRGPGAFDKTLEAAEACRQGGISVSLQCVMSSYNLGVLDDVVAIARAQGLMVMFQPATKWLDSSTEANPIAPPVEPYREAIAHLVELKRSGAPVRNSVAGLEHLAKWPDPTPIWCSAGVLTFSIEPDGTMLACHQAQVGRFLKGHRPGTALDVQYADLSVPKGCVQCWCAPMVELALLFSLRPAALWNALRSYL